MKIGDKILLSDVNIPIATLKDKVFICKYFIKWSLVEVDGYYQENIIYPKDKNEKIEFKQFIDKWITKLKTLGETRMKISEKDLIKLDDLVQYDVEVLAEYLYINYTGYSLELSKLIEQINQAKSIAYLESESTL